MLGKLDALPALASDDPQVQNQVTANRLVREALTEAAMRVTPELTA